MERNNEYLEERMYRLWEEYFTDVPRKNLVLIKFGRKSYRQLGSIKWANGRTKINGLLKKKVEEWKAQDDDKITVITVTKVFQNTEIPDYVVDATVAHEMIHYAHGFHSPLEKKYAHPHRGNVIKKEMDERGLLDMYLKSEKWLKENWRNYVQRRPRRNLLSYFSRAY